MDRETWKADLEIAADLLERVGRQANRKPQVVLGGGTVLMLRFDHQLSLDINLFLTDVQFLGFLSPRLNDEVAERIGGYVEQANSLKLTFRSGDIDFIVAGSVTRIGPEGAVMAGETVFPLESTAEILAKKFFYRAESVRVRDVFDFHAAMVRDGCAAERAIRACGSKRAVLLRNLAAIGATPEAELARSVLVLDGWAPMSRARVAEVGAFIAITLPTVSHR